MSSVEPGNEHEAEQRQAPEAEGRDELLLPIPRRGLKGFLWRILIYAAGTSFIYLSTGAVTQTLQFALITACGEAGHLAVLALLRAPQSSKLPERMDWRELAAVRSADQSGGGGPERRMALARKVSTACYAASALVLVVAVALHAGALPFSPEQVAEVGWVLFTLGLCCITFATGFWPSEFKEEVKELENKGGENTPRWERSL